MPSVFTLQELEACPPGPDFPALGVIGNPIAHSKSPQMQQAALDAARLPYRYIRLLCGLEEGEFPKLLQKLVEWGFRGVNITVPFKKQAFTAAVKADALSTLCGASNTLVNQEDGWHAFNTDGPGFERAIFELTGLSLSKLRILILGACGGAGSALACQCALASCPKLMLVNRPKPQLDALAKQLAGYTHTIPLAFHDSSLRHAVEEADLIVNATSLGLREGDPLPLPPEWLSAGQYVYDLVTHPTPFCTRAAAQGCTTDTGLAMLLWQGAFAFQHWFGQVPSISVMRDALLHA